MFCMKLLPNLRKCFQADPNDTVAFQPNWLLCFRNHDDEIFLKCIWHFMPVRFEQSISEHQTIIANNSAGEAIQVEICDTCYEYVQRGQEVNVRISEGLMTERKSILTDEY